MYTVWTQHLTNEKSKEEFSSSVQGSRTVLERLKEILESKEEALNSQEMSVKDFDTPNWSEKQAFRNGRRLEIHDLKKLVDLDTQEQPQPNKE